MFPLSPANIIIQDRGVQIAETAERHATRSGAGTSVSRIRFETLDVWRGLAATIVALFHLVVFSHLSGIALIRHGWIFVDFFFVLSGFVITHAYFTDLQERHRIGYFMLRRFGRLWPLHVSVLAILVLFEFTKAAFVKFHLAVPQPIFSDVTGTSLRSLVENILLIHAVGIDTVHSWNGPSWSISTEFWAYVVFALVCLLPNKRLVAFVAAAIALLSAIIVAAYSPNFMNATLELGMARCLYGFFCGHLVYRIWASANIRLKHPAMMEITALMLVILFTSWVQADPGSLLAPFIFGFAVWVFAFEAGPISGLMRNRAALAVGAWSYSIYMVHTFIIILIEKFASMATRITGVQDTIKMQYVPIGPPDYFIFFGSRWAMDILVLFYIGLIMCVAALTYRHIEQPGRRFFNRLARAHLDKGAPAVSPRPASPVPSNATAEAYGHLVQPESNVQKPS